MAEELLVVKYGSSSVTNEQGMDQTMLDHYAEQLSEVHSQYGLVVVTSGSIAVGEYLWSQAHGDIPDNSEQPFAMLGSALVVSAWQTAFRRQGVLAGQLLITHREIEDPSERWSLSQVMEENIRHGIVTIANENDALSDQEIAELVYGGENDGLASHIARALGARALCLLSDTMGLMDRDKVVKTVTPNQKGHDDALALAGASNGKGRGGMRKKVEAAINAASAGVESYIAEAGKSIDAILAGQSGTHFVARQRTM